VPLLSSGLVIGAIGLKNVDREMAFSDSDVRLLQTLASSMSVALESAHLFTEIESQRQYLEAIITNSPVAIITADLNGKVVSWNPAAETLFGYTPAEAIGKDTNDLIALSDEIRAEALICSIQTRKGELFHSITRRNRKDGTLVDVDMAVVPVSIEKESMGIVGIYHNITELQRARQEAVAANEAKSSFLATMSHEIRTPMNAVIGMSGLLMDTPLNKEQRDYAETIRNSSDALLAIINDILDFSKIEAGKMELEQQPFNLRECIESALDLVAARAADKGIDLAYLIEDDVPAGIFGDVTRLRQVMLNLLSNAVKFTEQGEVVLTVSRDKEKSIQVDRVTGTQMDKRHVSPVYVTTFLRFTVRDTGIGIPQGRIGQLFESFTQIDSSTTRKFGGTGLGLAISKRLAEMMGGSMWAESEGKDRGSTFSFTIRAKPAKITERKQRNLDDVWPALEGKRVLIVDDNPTNRRILVLQSRKWGLQPRETKSARQALRWLRQGDPFDLAIFDLQMPEMDGIMLARETRKVASGRSLPIILLTSLGRREVGIEDIEISAYLTKPLKPSALFDAIASIFVRQEKVEARSESGKLTLDPEMARRHPLRILLAEDNQVNQKLALRLLEQMGYRADVASNGLEAIESVKRQTYDVILMDVQMPEMDGLDATRAIRKLDIRQPYIIAMTANAMQGDRELCLAAGMEFYVSKPIRIPELVAALKLAKTDGR
jgi:PAS domain S-box-containing protein